MNKKIKILSLFSGIGAFEKALKNLNIDFELVGYCEIDKYASKSYAAIHNVDESMNLGDILKVDTSKIDNNVDLITYGFPCQDISVAGKQKGFENNGKTTRSGLFFEALRIINDIKPKIAIAENVKNLTGKKFIKEFEMVLSSLENAGYNNYWKVLNAKDFGVPQNRERVFIISIRKDVNDGLFTFPEPFELKTRLRDVLEDKVDEKFYLNDEQIKRIKIATYKTDAYKIQEKDWCEDIKAKKIDVEKVLDIPKDIIKDNERQRRVYSIDGASPTLLNRSDSPKIIEKNIEPVLWGGIGEKNFGSQYRQGNRIYDSNSIAMACLSQPVGNAGGNSYLYTVYEEPNTIIDDTQGFDGVRHYKDYSPSLRANRSGLKTVDDNLRIRKLTPKECWRLMGFDDGDFEKASKVNSNTQLYKQAGNSICVNVLVEIFKKLYKI